MVLSMGNEHCGNDVRADTSTRAVGATMARLRATSDSGRTHDLRWRREQLAALRRMLRTGESQLRAALVRDSGKEPFEALWTDVLASLPTISHAERHLDRWAAERRVSIPYWMRPGRASVRPQPRGVICIIGPWNYPVQLTTLPLAQAIAAGNCAVVKPSELMPETSHVLAELVDFHMDAEAVAVLEGDASTTTAIIESDPDLVFFTGSSRVGRVIATAAGARLIPTVLELGGKSPTIIAADADVEVAARRVVWTKVVNSGQTCVAADYALVDRRVKDRFIDAVLREIERQAPDSAHRSGIVTESHVDRLASLLTGHGGTLAVGGGVDRAHRRVDLTVISDPSPSSALMSEEIFGPILPVVAVDGVTEAIRFVNERPHPLAVYLFSSSDDTAQRVIAETVSGGVCVNHVIMQVGVDELPFGGVGLSGFGRYHGKAGFDTFSIDRSILRQRTRPDFPLLYPPYDRIKTGLQRLVLR